jgi:hypothetical protein
VELVLNTSLELAQCEKCNAFVFTCHVGGIRVIVDPGPLDGMDDVRRRLMMGRRVYRILPGRKLAVFGQLSTKGDGYLVDHWCTPGVAGVRKLPVEDAPRPPQAPVTPSAGPGLPSAPVSGSQGHTGLPIMSPVSSAEFPSRATRATRPRTDPKPTRCDICRGLITHDMKDVWSIEYDGRLVYARHDSC